MSTGAVAWLQAELARVEHQAVRAAELQTRDWSVPSTGVVDLGDDLLPTGDRDVAEHVALHDPAAVLRRVAADRQILAEHAPGGMAEERDETECRVCSGPTPGFSGSWPSATPCRTVLLLAEGWGWTAP